MRFFAISSFQKDLKKLLKKGYKSCKTDICKEFAGKPSEEIQQMQISIGESQGNQLIKRRIANTGQKLGKSKGYRLFFGIRLKTDVIFLHIYSKKEQVNPIEGMIQERLEEYEQEKSNLIELDIDNNLKEK